MNRALVANKACAERVRKRDDDLLKQRIRSMKPQIDTRPPETMHLDHLRNNLKREQMLEERYHEIDRDNRILLQKMSDIMKTPSVKSGAGGAHSGPVSLTRDARKAELSRITSENHAILKRIQQAQPVYNHVEWEEDYRRSFTHLKNCCEYPVALARKKTPARSSSLTPLSGGKGKSMSGTLTSLAPGENGYEGGSSAAPEMRYVLKEGMQLNGSYYLVEMATDGRSLAVTAYHEEQQKTLELLVNERTHRKLYRATNGDYTQIAARLRLDGEQIYIEHEELQPEAGLAI
eukprot:gb/GFBE01066478.1/.p1 GENE.gb/GFBE01066478.1/~~gb/GFBE01066478.1/.p1  ORF type:complete len:290 (+),score=60.29 gb/GFBE01066478.1/:1-870(+)